MSPQPYRQAHTTQPWVGIAFALLVLCALAVFTERATDVAFAFAVIVGVSLLATHSVELRVDRLGIEVRLGNGWRRVHVPLDDVVDWRLEDEIPVWGWGRSDADGTRRVGLGAPEALRLHTRTGDVVIGLDDPADAAAAIDAWRAIDLDEDDDEEPDS